MVLKRFSPILFFSLWFCAVALADDVIRIPLYTNAVNLNPFGVQDFPSLFVSRQINCQLVRLKSHEFVLEAAEEIKTLDPLNIQITLKPDQKFTSGAPLTANDVAATLTTLKSSRNILKSIIASVKSINVQSKYKLTITLDRPIPHFLKFLAAPNYSIFPSSFIKSALHNPSLWHRPDGCGEFKIIESDKIIKLKHLSKNKIVEFHLIADRALKNINFSKYDIIDSTFFDFSKAGNGFRTENTFDPKQLFVSLNSKLSRWKSKKARCNFLKGIDIAPILVAYKNDNAEIAKSLFPKGVVGYTPNSPFSHYNIKNNKTLNDALCLSFLEISVPKEKFAAYNQAISKVYSKIKNKIIPSTSNFGTEFLKSGCDAFVYGLKSNYLDGYEFLIVSVDSAADVTGGNLKKISKIVTDSQKVNDSLTRSSGYQLAESMLADQCLIRPLITIPYKAVLVNKNLLTPGIGETSLNDYLLSGVSHAK